MTLSNYQMGFRSTTIGDDPDVGFTDMGGLIAAGQPNPIMFDSGTADGQVVGAFAVKEKVITPALMLKGGSTADNVAALEALWAPATDRVGADELSFMLPSFTEPRSMWGKPTNRHFTETVDRMGVNVVQATLEFTCGDPFMYSTAVHSHTFAIGDTATITNDGSVAAQRGTHLPVATITGPIVNPYLWLNDTDGRGIKFPTLTLESGQTMVIDWSTGLITASGTDISGTENLFPYATGPAGAPSYPGFFALLPGANSIHFQADSGSGTCVLQWRSTWA